MTAHITARLAWHDFGWNGRICERPDCNTYCVGRYSFPGDVIARERCLEHEVPNAGKLVSELASGELPPCTYSVNAFGQRPIRGYSIPPDFFRGGASRTEWEIPEATVCVWPYEAMYGDGVRDERGNFDNDLRSAKAGEFFAQIEVGKSLVFYYANYSNPFSEEDCPRYALIGVSRVKGVGDRLIYDESNEYIRERFAGGMIWGRNVSSCYPEEGLRLPYHRYRDHPETLRRIAVFPENPRTCKYGARLLTNDDAIGLLENLLTAVYELKALGDESEDWELREKWLLGCIVELWHKRGLYPGLLNVMRFLSAEQATMPARSLIEQGQSKDVHRLFFEAVDRGKEASELQLVGRALDRVVRQWQLQPESARIMLRDVLALSLRANRLSGSSARTKTIVAHTVCLERSQHR